MAFITPSKHSPLAACSTIFGLSVPLLGGFDNSLATCSTSHGFFHPLGAPLCFRFPLPTIVAAVSNLYPSFGFNHSLPAFIAPSRSSLLLPRVRYFLATFTIPSRLSLPPHGFRRLPAPHSLCYGFHYGRPDVCRRGFDCSLGTFTNPS